jgi:hypothetical protein
LTLQTAASPGKIECLAPLYPTPEEQRNMNPFRIAMAANGTYPSCPDGGDCSTTNATLGDDHFVVTNFYDYAVEFRRRVQATMIKGESADINIIYYRIFSRTDNSTAVRARGFFALQQECDSWSVMKIKICNVNCSSDNNNPCKLNSC